MTYTTNNKTVNYKHFHIVTYNVKIKYAFIDFLRAHDCVILGVSGYYFDNRGREGYYIDFNIPADMDINGINEHIDYLYSIYGE